jgi:DNA-binding YbaB/EbfC family protein
MDIQGLMRQAQEMQKKIQAAQEEVASKEYEGQAGGGMVKVVIGGNGIAKSVNIDPTLLNESEKEVLEDLLIAAFNNARKNIDEDSGGAIKDSAGGVQLPPGFKL